jgi:hypothetical protein
VFLAMLLLSCACSDARGEFSAARQIAAFRCQMMRACMWRLDVICNQDFFIELCGRYAQDQLHT